MGVRDAMAGPLKFIKARRHGGANGKDSVMWVFDGEEWTQDNGGVESSTSRQDAARPQWPVEIGPELQVIEIEIVQPVPTTGRHIPPFPH
jgi:hypothetical protein